MTAPRSPLIYVIAGEPSGDLLGARLIAALKEATNGQARFAGIGGEAMAEEGLTSLFPLADIAVMGLLEVLPRAPLILKRVRQTVEDIVKLRPDAIVTIDSWGFTGRVARALMARGNKAPRLHYVAPMVWAWREGRARHMAGRVDHLLTLFPNEPPYFEAHGLKATHVGHSVIEAGADQGDGAAFRARHDVPSDAPLLCLLPGSRRSETSRLLPVFKDTLSILKTRHPGSRVVVPTVDTVAQDVAQAASEFPLPAIVVRGRFERYDAFAACDVALAASGTVALELALAGLPSVITYKVSALSAHMAKRLLKIRFVNLVNLQMDRMVVPELIQDQCRAPLLADEVSRLLTDEAARQAQIDGMGEAMIRLGHGQSSPSRRAADEVLKAIETAKEVPA